MNKRMICSILAELRRGQLLCFCLVGDVERGISFDLGLCFIESDLAMFRFIFNVELLFVQNDGAFIHTRVPQERDVPKQKKEGTMRLSMLCYYHML